MGGFNYVCRHDDRVCFSEREWLGAESREREKVETLSTHSLSHSLLPSWSQTYASLRAPTQLPHARGLQQSDSLHREGGAGLRH